MTTRRDFVFRKQFQIIALLTIFSLLNIAITYADEGQPAPQTTQQQAVPNPQPMESQDSSSEINTDQTHKYLEKNILEQIVRLDDFFGRTKSEHLRKTSYLLRWRNSLRLDEDGKLKPAITFRANIHLSRLNERLRLSISGEDVTETNTQSIPEDPGNPGFDRTTQPTRLVNTELRYILKQTTNIDSFLGAGIRLNFPMKTFIRGRFLYKYQLSDIAQLRLSETLFLRSQDGFGETTEISLERLLNPRTLIRWANSGTVAESITGMEWGSELSLIQELSSKSAVSVTGGIYGNSSSSALVTDYQIRTNYRLNFLRHWLFYEVEPEISWPRDTGYSANFAITLRLEIMFAGSDVKQEK